MPEIWDLIVVGRGSAAAYYLSALDRSQFPNILVIGLDDPWSGERGYNKGAAQDPVNFINHTWQMLVHLCDDLPEFSRELVDRYKFAQANARVIDQCATTVIRDKVIEVAESLESEEFSAYGRAIQVKVESGKKWYTGKKLVVAGGAGGHRVPEEVKGLVSGRIMDMDAFARKAGTYAKGLTVFVHGPNAAIDSVETAKFQGFKVIWLVKGNSQPALLATGHQVYAIPEKDKIVRYPDHKRGTKGFTVSLHGNQIKVSIPGESAPREGDYYVYGMGQEPADAMKGIFPPGFENRLQPVYDINQRFGDAHQSVIGLKLENSDWKSGYEVVGALATQVARGHNVKHTYQAELGGRIEELRKKVLPFVSGVWRHPEVRILLKPLSELGGMSPGDARVQMKTAMAIVTREYPTWPPYVRGLCVLMLNYIKVSAFFRTHPTVTDADLSAAASILTPSVIQGPQLGVIRSQVTSHAAAVPAHVRQGKANFSSDDATVLAVFIYYWFPFVREEDAERIISQIIAGRKTANKGFGYDAGASQKFVDELDTLNRKELAVFTRAKKSGSGQTVLH